ncbi:methyltransferase family protein [Flavobacterium sp. HNIBRBA15423]|uniref:methyltransferase family protein n=1 Tax=Flavobacterium sp. HNIBRBA15423 TaxID=3458683 RepID=UPI004044176F
MNIKYKDLFFVGIQICLFACFILDFTILISISNGLKTVSLFIAITGLLIIIVATIQLNKKISPFPTPKNKAILIQNDLYKYSRHPIYTGIVLFVFESSFYLASVYKSIISILLLILFYFKSAYEEILLQDKFPNYTIYKQKTSYFFIKMIDLCFKKGKKNAILVA